MRILKGGASRLVFSPDGRTLLADGSVLWDVVAGTSFRLPDYLSAWGFAPDGEALWGRAVHIPSIFPRDGGICIRQGSAGAFGVGEMALSVPAGRLAVAVPRGLHWWAWPSLELLGGLEIRDFVGRFAFSADGLRVVSLLDNGIEMRDVATKDWVWQVRGRKLDRNPVGPRVSPDGRWVAMASGMDVLVYSTDRAKESRIKLERKRCRDLAFTPDGRFVVIVSDEGAAKAYDTSTWTLKHELAWEIGALKSIAFSPDGMLGAAGGVKKIVVWDMDW